MSGYDLPVALLIGRDGYERIVGITEPPPPFFDVPIRTKWRLDGPEEPPRYEPLKRRTFRLDSARAKDVRFWRVYNEGRSRTPEGAYVYFEVAAADKE